MTVTQDLLYKNLRLLRHTKGLSQVKVANAIYLTRTTYCSYENGTKPIDMQTIDALANLYDISFDSLVNFDITKGIISHSLMLFNVLLIPVFGFVKIKLEKNTQ